MEEQDYRLKELMLSFRMTIESCCDGLWEAPDRIMRTVQTLPCVQADLDDLHLALVEALTNAVLDGNREDPAKTVGIFGGCDGQEQLLIGITDQGNGFDLAALPDPTAAENMCASHGRGVFLMKRLVDEVEFNLGGRQVVLRKRIAGATAFRKKLYQSLDELQADLDDWLREYNLTRTHSGKYC